MSTDRWWIAQKGNDPVGPVTADLLLRGIEAGKVPADTLICRVGDKEWSHIAEVPPFASALAALGTGANDPEEVTVVDASPLEGDTTATDLPRFDEVTEKTLVDVASGAESLEPPTLVDEPLIVDAGREFDDPDETTVVD